MLSNFFRLRDISFLAKSVLLSRYSARRDPGSPFWFLCLMQCLQQHGEMQSSELWSRWVPSERKLRFGKYFVFEYRFSTVRFSGMGAVSKISFQQSSWCRCAKRRQVASRILRPMSPQSSFQLSNVKVWTLSISFHSKNTTPLKISTGTASFPLR